MLDDPRSSALADNFAGQWLSLRPQKFSIGVRTARRHEAETRLFFDPYSRNRTSESPQRHPNERLATSIEGVKGPRRRIETPQRHPGPRQRFTRLPPHAHQRRRECQYILNNILATRCPASADVDARRGLRRRSASCAADGETPGGRHLRLLPQQDGPGGFWPENYDGIGKWRTMDGNSTIPQALPN
jgi:hypothetical protein